MNHFIALTLLLLLTACGDTVSTKNVDPFEKILTTSFSNEPLILEKQSQEVCRQKTFDESNSHFLMHLFLDGNTQTRTEDFLTLLQGNFIRDNLVISRSVYGEKVELIQTMSGTRSYLRAGPRDINVCPEEDTYAPDTVESAAISTSHYIKKTFAAFKDAVPEIAIRPITLTISPLIIRTTIGRDHSGEQIKYSSYMTDNAVYFPVDNAIAFLPTSRELRDNGINMKFWEVPMVASHEYGHHIFKSIYGLQGTTLGYHICFDQADEETKSNLRHVTNNDVLTAINEAFADLVSFYTLDETERSVMGLTCLEVTRDVNSPVMINRKEKKFSAYALSSYFSYIPDYSNGCQNPSYQENHILGSIIAYNSNLFLSKMTQSDGEKLRAITAWIKRLKVRQDAMAKLDPREFLQGAMKEFFVESVETLNREWDDKLCQEARNIYPEVTLDQCAYDI